jgi:hypothetical protein
MDPAAEIDDQDEAISLVRPTVGSNPGKRRKLTDDRDRTGPNVGNSTSLPEPSVSDKHTYDRVDRPGPFNNYVETVSPIKTNLGSSPGKKRKLTDDEEGTSTKVSESTALTGLSSTDRPRSKKINKARKDRGQQPESSHGGHEDTAAQEIDQSVSKNETRTGPRSPGPIATKPSTTSCDSPSPHLEKGTARRVPIPALGDTESQPIHQLQNGHAQPAHNSIQGHTQKEEIHSFPNGWTEPAHTSIQDRTEAKSEETDYLQDKVTDNSPIFDQKESYSQEDYESAYNPKKRSLADIYPEEFLHGPAPPLDFGKSPSKRRRMMGENAVYCHQ